MGNNLPNIRFLCCNFCQERSKLGGADDDDDDNDNDDNVPRKISINCACFHSQNFIDEIDGDEQRREEEEEPRTRRQLLLRTIKCWRTRRSKEIFGQQQQQEQNC